MTVLLQSAYSLADDGGRAYIQDDQEVGHSILRQSHNICHADMTHSAPAWPPTPKPPRPIAEGADQAEHGVSKSKEISPSSLTPILSSRNDYASARSRGDHESSLEDGEDGESRGLFKDRAGNDLRRSAWVQSHRRTSQTDVPCPSHCSTNRQSYELYTGQRILSRPASADIRPVAGREICKVLTDLGGLARFFLQTHCCSALAWQA